MTTGGEVCRCILKMLNENNIPAATECAARNTDWLYGSLIAFVCRFACTNTAAVDAALAFVNARYNAAALEDVFQAMCRSPWNCESMWLIKSNDYATYRRDNLLDTPQSLQGLACRAALATDPVALAHMVHLYLKHGWRQIRALVATATGSHATSMGLAAWLEKEPRNSVRDLMVVTTAILIAKRDTATYPPREASRGFAFQSSREYKHYCDAMKRQSKTPMLPPHKLPGEHVLREIPPMFSPQPPVCSVLKIHTLKSTYADITLHDGKRKKFYTDFAKIPVAATVTDARIDADSLRAAFYRMDSRKALHVQVAIYSRFKRAATHSCFMLD